MSCRHSLKPTLFEMRGSKVKIIQLLSVYNVVVHSFEPVGSYSVLLRLKSITWCLFTMSCGQNLEHLRYVKVEQSLENIIECLFTMSFRNKLEPVSFIIRASKVRIHHLVFVYNVLRHKFELVRFVMPRLKVRKYHLVSAYNAMQTEL